MKGNALLGMKHDDSSLDITDVLPSVLSRVVAAYQKKYPGSPVDSGVLSGYNAAQLLGQDLEEACDSGSLWITEDDQMLDTVLEPGEQFAPVARGALLVYALSPARLHRLQ